ncbi:DUF7024 domain-containing protein [Bradyrhizobium sp. USDA 241]|uniref:DUF7024 domain-containing protein n=1 Tax=Bradyrhizobium sp. USDA 241 TaxID=3377725 RepID=UPI003C73F68C
MPRASQMIGWFVIGAVVLGGSFFGSLRLIDWYFPGLGYDVASLPRLEIGRTVTFGNGENRGALIQGWSNPESWGVWSDGNLAELGFVVLGSAGEDARLVIEYKAFINDRMPRQEVQFWSRNTELNDVTLAKASGTITVQLAGLRLGPGYPLILQLRIPLATSPRQLALSQDARKLGLGLVSVRFEK